MRKANTRPIYLSPHLDDVALSCAGLIHRQTRQGMQPLVITCFAGMPDYHVLSPFAAELHLSWGEWADPVELRRCEDAAAMAYLGAAYQHWDYLDCIYRRHPDSGEFLYASVPAIFGELHSEERSLIDELAARLIASLPVEGTEIYAPLAVGHHVDHQIVFQAALRVRFRGLSVQCYEDYPYAEDSENLSEAVQRWTSPPLPTVLTLNEEDLEVRIAAIRFYRSQLDMLFGGESPMVTRVKAYALAMGAGQSYGERYWEGGAW